MRKQRRIQSLLADYMDTWRCCIDTFEQGWRQYLDEGLTDRFAHLVDATHKHESRADDQRRQLEWELYSKALVPESRGDILGVLESVDRLLSMAEWSMMEVSLQKLEVPASVQSSLGELVGLVHRCGQALDDAIRSLMVNGDQAEQVLMHTERVDALESESDHLERNTIRVIFEQDDLQPGDKVLLKEVVRNLASVADQAEAVANRLMIASVKRRV
jgi:predicted phosphate transport protein (TIGR00153 family)